MVAVWFIATLFVVFVGLGGTYILDDTPGLGRVFDGIGGLSGGGATSRLLVSYPPKQRAQILDYLFLPKFAASLHILKVEIGGDAQSTDGTESSHMHTATDENYERGYEWWLMTEAKKRNPDIKLYGLPWAFPGWVGKESNSPYTYPELTAGYIVKWILGAKKYYNLTIDYVGIWNERGYNITYIKTLRHSLDDNELFHVQIVAADTDFNKISEDIISDQELNKAVSILGAHYPGTLSNAKAVSSSKPLWASEDYSTYNDNIGSGCWARILNQNYVNGHMTSTISWNLIASYYSGLPFYRDGLMTAIEPWSGSYVVEGPIWISAHTTQFTQPGVHYLAHGSGVGKLDGGGSYVTFFDPKTNDFSIVIETMSHNMSVCIRPPLPAFNVTQQNASFVLKGNLAGAKVSELNVWMSSISSGSYFKQLSSIEVSEEQQFTLSLDVDTVYTITTLTGQSHSTFTDIPDSQSFPIPYSDDFESYNLNSEANYFADQVGVYEIVNEPGESGNKVMRQVITDYPIKWCAGGVNTTISVIGDVKWLAVSTKVSLKLEGVNTSAFLAAGVNGGGCSIGVTAGIHAWLSNEGWWMISSDLGMADVLAFGRLDFEIQIWHTISIQTFQDGDEKKAHVIISPGGKAKEVDIDVLLPKVFSGGFVGFGTGRYYPAQFDSFSIDQASTVW